MFIHEAILATTKNRPFITRKSWMVEGSFTVTLKLRPTDTPDGIVAYSAYSGIGPARGWQPRAEDLRANDWMVLLAEPVKIPQQTTWGKIRDRILCKR